MNKHEPGIRLTPTQAKVMTLFSQGLKRKEVGTRIGVSMSTVDFHLEEVKHRCWRMNPHKTTTKETVALLIRLGLIPVEIPL